MYQRQAPRAALVPSVQELSPTGKTSLLLAASCTSLEEGLGTTARPAAPTSASRSAPFNWPFGSERKWFWAGANPGHFAKCGVTALLGAQPCAGLSRRFSRRNHRRLNFPRPALPWHLQTGWEAGRPIPGCERIPPWVSRSGGMPRGGHSQAGASAQPLLPPGSQRFRHRVPEPSGGCQPQEVQRVMGTGLRTGG